MVQWATQCKAVAAIGTHGQGKDLHPTSTGGQHIARHTVAQRHTTAGQRLFFQAADITAKAKAACPIGTKVDQPIEGASQTCCAHILFSPFTVAAGQRIFMDQTTHRLFFPISQSWYVIQDGDIKGIAGRITITIDQHHVKAFA
ncbi:hypothetical protein D3C85_1062930 [compost metagenome]